MTYSLHDVRNNAEAVFNSIFGLDAKIPPADIFENDKEYIIEADLPGYDHKKVNVSVENHVLRISYEHGTLDDIRDEEYREIKRERSKCSFERDFALPECTDEEKINGEFVNGVLIITIPKKPQTSPKKIDVKIK